MTVGIYALYWEEQDLIYIGQSRDIHTRTNRHLSDLRKLGHINEKLQKAYNDYGKPSVHLLHECKEAELEKLERSYILEFDSMRNGLNKTNGSGSVSGTDHGSSKYSRIKILRVFSLLIRTNKSLAEIADRAKVNYYLVVTIKNGKGHFWLKDTWPDLYALLQDPANERNREYISLKTTSVTLRSPEGFIYKNVNISSFVQNNLGLFKHKNKRLVCNGLYKVTSGVRSSYLGWKII